MVYTDSDTLTTHLTRFISLVNNPLVTKTNDFKYVIIKTR